MATWINKLHNFHLVEELKNFKKKRKKKKEHCNAEIRLETFMLCHFNQVPFVK